MRFVGSHPGEFSAQRPAAPRGRIIKKHQGRVVGYQHKGENLSEKRNKVDQKSTNGDENTKKGNLETLIKVKKDTADCQSFVVLKLCTCLNFLRRGCEQTISRRSECVRQQEGKIESHYPGNEKIEPFSGNPADIFQPAQNSRLFRRIAEKASGQIIDKVDAKLVPYPGKENGGQEKQEAPAHEPLFTEEKSNGMQKRNIYGLFFPQVMTVHGIS